MKILLCSIFFCVSFFFCLHSYALKDEDRVIYIFMGRTDSSIVDSGTEAGKYKDFTEDGRFRSSDPTDSIVKVIGRDGKLVESFFVNFLKYDVGHDLVDSKEKIKMLPKQYASLVFKYSPGLHKVQIFIKGKIRKEFLLDNIK